MLQVMLLRSIAAAALLLILITGCSSAPRLQRGADYASACQARGGKIVQLTQSGQGCEWPTTDATRACSDSRQCQGHCEPARGSDGASARPGEPSAGICSATQNAFGFPNCELEVKKGVVETARCVD